MMPLYGSICQWHILTCTIQCYVRLYSVHFLWVSWTIGYIYQDGLCTGTDWQDSREARMGDNGKPSPTPPFSLLKMSLITISWQHQYQPFFCCSSFSHGFYLFCGIILKTAHLDVKFAVILPLIPWNIIRGLVTSICLLSHCLPGFPFSEMT